MEVPQKTISPNDLVLLINDISQKAVGEDLAYQKLIYILHKMDLSKCLSSTLYSRLKDLKQQIICQTKSDSEIFRIFCSQVINESELSHYGNRSNFHINKFISNRWMPSIDDLNICEKNNLPKEILQYILRYLLFDNPSWTTVENFAMVSKAFFQASIDPIIFKELLEKGSTDQLDLNPNFVISRLEELRHFRNIMVNFSNSSFIDFENYEALSSCLNFSSFEITDAKNSKKKFITDNNIKRLAMSSPDLNTLILHNAEDLTNLSLFFLALRCKHLKTLKIKLCRKSNITHHGLNILMTCCRKLKNFGISFCEDKEFQKINSNFIKISKNDCMDLNMNELANVRSSYDPWLEFMTNNALTFKEFELGNVGIDNKFFEKIINASASIFKKISIEKSNRLTLEGISCLMKCKKLEYFILFDFKIGLEDETLAKLTREWSELKTCAIYEASKITSKGFDSLILNCPKLEILTLDNYTVNLETINALFYRDLPLSLQKITFGSSCFVNVKAADIIEQIAFNANLLPKLKALHFNSAFDEITVDQLEILATFFPSLELIWAQSKLPSEKDLEQFEERHPNFILIGS